MHDITKLQVGDTLQLQNAPPSTNADRYAVRVIGYLPDKSVVTTTPTKDGRVLLIREGQRFAVRVLNRDTVVGFNTSVLQSASKPYPHLHLSYPNVVEARVVRNAQRVETEILAQLRNSKMPDEEANYYSATVLDISLTGARLCSQIPLAEVDDVLQINIGIKVCDSQELLKMLVDVVSINLCETENETGTEGEYIYGVAFRSLNRIQKLLLCAYVKGRIAEER